MGADTSRSSVRLNRYLSLVYNPINTTNNYKVTAGGTRECMLTVTVMSSSHFVIRA
jgi:hypothetical protein